MAKFKVRRQAQFMSAASFAGDLRVDSDFSTSAMTVSSGTNITHILAGSGQAVFGALAADATSTTCVAITGLTQAHKIFIGASDVSGSLIVDVLACSPGGDLLIFGVTNSGSETYAAATETFSYLAILDK